MMRVLKVLLDADTFLEFFLNRSGFIEDIEKLLEYVEQTNLIELYITDLCLKKIDNYKSFIADNTLEETKYLVQNSLFKDRIIKIDRDRDLFEKARKNQLPDFDSWLEFVCAKKMSLDGIVTHNPLNFGFLNDRDGNEKKVRILPTGYWQIIKLNNCLKRSYSPQPKSQAKSTYTSDYDERKMESTRSENENDRQDIILALEENNRNREMREESKEGGMRETVGKSQDVIAILEMAMSGEVEELSRDLRGEIGELIEEVKEKRIKLEELIGEIEEWEKIVEWMKGRDEKNDDENDDEDEDLKMKTLKTGNFIIYDRE